MPRIALLALLLSACGGALKDRLKARAQGITVNCNCRCEVPPPPK